MGQVISFHQTHTLQLTQSANIKKNIRSKNKKNLSLLTWFTTWSGSGASSTFGGTRAGLVHFMTLIAPVVFTAALVSLSTAPVLSRLRVSEPIKLLRSLSCCFQRRIRRGLTLFWSLSCCFQRRIRRGLTLYLRAVAQPYGKESKTMCQRGIWNFINEVLRQSHDIIVQLSNDQGIRHGAVTQVRFLSYPQRR